MSTLASVSLLGAGLGSAAGRPGSSTGILSRASHRTPAAVPLCSALYKHERPRSLGEGQRLGSTAVSRPFKSASGQRGRSAVSTSSAGPTRQITRMGLPIPIIGFLFTPFTVALLYFAAAVKFWAGYSRTVYSQAMTTKLALTALWPVLFVVNETFRQNFKKAM
eukprot:CAMPEP_0117682304 /NCGR_PEP_ID=MMETSP0804-20121206/19571_1 /TAXON_ID=1074897 /ORGANISM="Tetraselmis astigmatica, Strain CCMP880" /LENGTH=163 /DNA_ID=CAMNT_0005492373 /DNA_START=93 /DNA_END=584 /DNA_ORIENTATION=+